MHTIAVQLAPVLGAEKSKVPFYIAGGLLVAWALFISLGVGARRSDFPDGPSQQRAVIAVTAVLVLAAVSMAVLTSGGAASSQAAAGSPQTRTAGGAGGAESSSAQSSSATPSSSASQTSSTAQPSAPGTTPKATTGTPAPASSPAAQRTSLKLAANMQGLLSYDAKQLSAKAGSVTLAFTNGSQLAHNVTIAQGGTVLGATPTFVGGTKSLHLTLKPGKYTFYCSVPGHRQAGMEGTLSVS